MKFTSDNDNNLNKTEPQLEDHVVEVDAGTAQDKFSGQESANEHHQTKDSNTYRSHSAEHNPVLQFVKNLGETAEYLWGHYLDWVIHVSWGKMFLACLLVLIAGSCFFLHTIANWFVFGSLLLKCFIGKEDQSAKRDSSAQVKPEEN